MDRVCPLLALAADRRSAVDGVDATHRCWAEDPPAPLERQLQARLCLTPDHERCERLLQYLARGGAVPAGLVPIGDGLVSTRLLLAPEPAWRGLAGRARRARPGPAMAVGAGVIALGVGGIAIGAAAIDGRLDAVAITGTMPSASPTAPPTPTPTATPVATVIETPSPAPTQPTATVAPTVVPTAVPTATPEPPPPTPRTYVVQEGDTLALIAQQFGVSIAAIQSANGIEDPNTIIIGQVLVIP
ncbi:MAG: LysM peptidoglycan-binding domain-containing protein [Candidatus Limnocylindria bacterium]